MQDTSQNRNHNSTQSSTHNKKQKSSKVSRPTQRPRTEHGCNDGGVCKNWCWP